MTRFNNAMVCNWMRGLDVYSDLKMVETMHVEVTCKNVKGGRKDVKNKNTHYA